jgi:hypothetical protein
MVVLVYYPKRWFCFVFWGKTRKRAAEEKREKAIVFFPQQKKAI